MGKNNNHRARQTEVREKRQTEVEKTTDVKAERQRHRQKQTDKEDIDRKKLFLTCTSKTCGLNST